MSYIYSVYYVVIPILKSGTGKEDGHHWPGSEEPSCELVES